MVRMINLQGVCRKLVLFVNATSAKYAEMAVARMLKELLITVSAGYPIEYLGLVRPGLFAPVYATGLPVKDSHAIWLRPNGNLPHVYWFFPDEDFYLVCGLVQFCRESKVGLPIGRHVGDTLNAFMRRGSKDTAVIALTGTDRRAVTLGSLPGIAAGIAIGRRGLLARRSLDLREAVQEFLLDQCT
jgi:hypothetical protein